MEINIVICTHNRSHLLAKTLTSLNDVERPSDTNITIIVVANACSDSTGQLLSDYRKTATKNQWLPLEWVEERKLGKSNALNRALSTISGGILCFVDDDHRIDPGYFHAVVNAIHRYPEGSLFCGKVIPDWTGREPKWVHDTGRYRIYPFPVPHFELGDQPCTLTKDSRIPGGGNLFARRELFDRVGGFSCHLGPQGHNLLGGEDSDFVLRALRSGEKVQYVPDLVQFHYADLNHLTLPYIIRKSFQRSRSITLARLTQKTKTPMYLWRKLLNYCVTLVFSFSRDRARFYLVRISSILGELQAFRENKKSSLNIDRSPST